VELSSAFGASSAPSRPSSSRATGAGMPLLTANRSRAQRKSAFRRCSDPNSYPNFSANPPPFQCPDARIRPSTHHAPKPCDTLPARSLKTKSPSRRPLGKWRFWRFGALSPCFRASVLSPQPPRPREDWTKIDSIFRSGLSLVLSRPAG
jgi:hypothetical protein